MLPLRFLNTCYVNTNRQKQIPLFASRTNRDFGRFVKQDFWFGLAGFGFRGSVMRERQRAHPVSQGQPVHPDMRHSAIPTAYRTLL